MSSSRTLLRFITHPRTFNTQRFQQSALFSSSPTVADVKLPDLPYDYGDLEPYISADIMRLHHQKHHQTYVNNFNQFMQQYAEAESKKEFTKLIALQGGLKFNGGGHINHSIFWTNLAPSKKTTPKPTTSIAQAMDKEFGSFDKFQSKFNASALSVQGSGWAWLGYNKDFGRLEITTCPNQDPLTGLIPLLGFDVWEHAYYLQYKNVRGDYLKAIWNVINWADVQKRYDNARK